MSSSEFEAYTPRQPAKNVKKPVIYPGKTVITGTPDMLEAIDRLYPDEGNARRESTLLTRLWANQFRGAPVPKSMLIAVAAWTLQRSDQAFANQDRKNGDGFSRAKCTFSKTCNWMLEQGLFVVVRAIAARDEPIPAEEVEAVEA